MMGLDNSTLWEMWSLTNKRDSNGLAPSDQKIGFGDCVDVFTTAIQFDYPTIAGRIRELAFLNPEDNLKVLDFSPKKVVISGVDFGRKEFIYFLQIAYLAIVLKKEDTDPEKCQFNEYCYAGGLVEYVRWLNTDKKPLHDIVGFRKQADGITIDVALQCSLIQKPLHDIVGFRKQADGITIDVALQWCSDAYSDTMLGYANSIRTIDGGTHIDGMKASLTRTLNNLGKKSKILKMYALGNDCLFHFVFLNKISTSKKKTFYKLSE
ncbi:hypothetical protein TEA_021351 [Camellia sinensis var. sinensis]|uniref:DNA topoisomerase (ATP-hydrolyzing) n=1 Tax=Camellia sinensis var. sinensis TaxID=542762 RepID=A0A4V3WL86_CAMSN|nr:hypothetical protein TEA_021351 [Camellia sinensis var. sinensis]